MRALGQRPRTGGVPGEEQGGCGIPILGKRAGGLGGISEGGVSPGQTLTLAVGWVLCLGRFLESVWSGVLPQLGSRSPPL